MPVQARKMAQVAETAAGRAMAMVSQELRNTVQARIKTKLCDNG
jgi:hypothetical protein